MYATRKNDSLEAFQYVIIKEPIIEHNPSFADMFEIDLSQSWYDSKQISNKTIILLIQIHSVYRINMTNMEKFQWSTRQHELYGENDNYVDDLLRDLATMPIATTSIRSRCHFFVYENIKRNLFQNKWKEEHN